MPMTGDEACLDRALVERKPEMRAAILDRERRAAVPEHDDGQGPDLGDQLAGWPAAPCSEPARTPCSVIREPVH